MWAVSRYIEKNPVRARIVKNAQDYSYSSAKAHILGKDNGLLNELLFSEEELYNYREFIKNEDDNADLDDIRKQTKLGKPLGDSKFLETLSKKLNLSLNFKPKGRPRKGMCP